MVCAMIFAQDCWWLSICRLDVVSTRDELNPMSKIVPCPMTGTFNTLTASLVNARKACNLKIVAAEPEIFQKKSVHGQSGLTMGFDMLLGTVVKWDANSGGRRMG